MVDRRVRQHHADQRIPRGDGFGQRGVPRRGVALAEQHDRRRRRVEQRVLAWRQVGEPQRRLAIAHHHGERLLRAVLAASQARDGGVVGCQAGQVVAAEPLDRDDRSRAERSRGRVPTPRRRSRPSRPSCGSRAAGRNRDSRSAARGSAGRAGPSIRRDRQRTSRTPPSSSAAGRRGRPRTIVKRGPQLVQVMNGCR